MCVRTSLRTVILIVALIVFNELLNAATVAKGNVDFTQRLEADTIHFRDSLAMFSKEDFEDEVPEDIVDITFIIPRTDEIASTSIKARIRQMLGCKEKDDFMKMAQEKARKRFAEHKKEIKADGDDFNPAPWGYYATFKMKSMSPKYITMTCFGDDYRGGPHGTPFFWGFTVLRESGRILSWKDFSDKPDLLLPFIEEGFGKYREANMEMLNENNEKLPLPKTAPWIERESIVFQYQPYEIGIYAMGAPLSKVFLKEKAQSMPVGTVKPLITELINTYDSFYDIAPGDEDEYLGVDVEEEEENYSYSTLKWNGMTFD